MNKTIFKTRVAIGSIVIAVIGGAAIHHLYAQGANLSPIHAPSVLVTTRSAPASLTSHSVHGNTSAAVGMALEYVADFSNDRVLMGASHDVFVGKILKQIGSKEQGIGPETQFQVQVILDIKGGLQGTVTVDQEGGYENGTLYYVQGGVPLLKPGATYLLATRYSPPEDWYTLNPSISGSQFIIYDPNLSLAKLQAMAQNDMRVKQLEAVYPNEILLDADVKNSNALNSYQSLHGVVSSNSAPEKSSPQK
jgi:hypothetical protein